MGLNYRVESYPPCPSCGHIAETKHLGKQSVGWAFLFHGYPDEDLISWAKWFIKIMSGQYLIKDEEDRVILLKDFCEMIHEKKHLLTHFGSLDPRDHFDSDGYCFYDGDFS